MRTLTIKTKPIIVNRKHIVAGNRLILSKEYRDTKEAMQWEIKSTWGNFERLAGSVELNVLLYFGDNRKRDIDAYLKILLDAMSGIVYEDDSQIDALHVYKEVDIKNPRTIIQIV